MLLYLLAHLHMMDQVTWGGGEGEGEREGGGERGEEGGRGRWKGGGKEVEVEKRRGVAAYEGGRRKGWMERIEDGRNYD